jgi:hypothetical protein
LGNLKLNDVLKDINRIPIEKKFKSIEDAFGHYSEGSATYKQLYFKSIPKIKGRIAKRNDETFNKEELSDFRFKINDKLIFASKLYLMSETCVTSKLCSLKNGLKADQMSWKSKNIYMKCFH